jgi:L-amino acid N-acyltransferase YncA
MSRLSIAVRPAKVEDAEQILAILNPVIAEGLYSVFDKQLTVEAERDYIRSAPARRTFLVAVDTATDRVIGFQVLDQFEASYTGAFDHVGVMGTYVAQDYRRQGVASALFAASFIAAREAGFEKIATYVRADNPAALATYQAHGFTIVGTAKKHAKLNRHCIDEVLIERQL